MESNKLKQIRINSFNCRGLRGDKKRLSIFHWIKESHNGITFLQETHSMISDEKSWEREWDGDIYFSHGGGNAKGVAILIPKQLNIKFEYVNGQRDKNGRIILLEGNFKMRLLS